MEIIREIEPDPERRLGLERSADERVVVVKSEVGMFD